jgi:catechol 2,3-dioxygenase
MDRIMAGGSTMSQTSPLQRTPNCFLPRRLGHANLYISDYEKAAAYYRSVVGFNEAYSQPDNMASFVSNGNTYHDFGLTSTKSKYAKNGQEQGLFHFALELENEIDLVEGYKRAVAAGLPLRSTVDHDVALRRTTKPWCGITRARSA